jgi:hypothetical protein
MLYTYTCTQNREAVGFETLKESNASTEQDIVHLVEATLMFLQYQMIIQSYRAETRRTTAGFLKLTKK